MDSVTAGHANHLLAPSAVTAKPANEAAADDPRPDSTGGALDHLALANWAAASAASHVNNSGCRHAPWVLAWKSLIAGSGCLTVVGWLRRSHMSRWGLIVISVSGMRHSDLLLKIIL